MGKKSWVCSSLFCIFFLQLFTLQAQKIQKTLSIVWENNILYTVFEDETREFLHFSGAIYGQEYPTLPQYYEQLFVDVFFEDYSVTLSNVQYEAMSAHDCSLIPEAFRQTTLQVNVTSAYERSKPCALLSFIPIIRTGDRQCSRVTSLTIIIEGHGIRAPKKGKAYASQSVLASGNWYKFSVSQTGIYQVTYNDLITMGMSGTIYSTQLALFGNGGGMLPEYNGAPRIDDLQELPIHISDGGDGIMNEGDYFIFYGESPHTWTYDTTTLHFSHTTNIYSDATYYFVTATAGIGVKKRIQTVDNNALTATRTVGTYTHYAFIEDDLYNLGETGKVWLGDLFDVTTSRTYTFPIPGCRQEAGRLVLSVAGVSPSGSSMNIKVNGSHVGSLWLSSIISGNLASLNSDAYTFTPSSPTLSITLEYSKPTASSSAYLDQMEIEVPCNLTMHSAQFPFCNPSTVQPGSVTQFNIGNAGASTKIWDVTQPADVCRMALTAGNGTCSFKAVTDTLRKFYAFDGTHYLSVTPIAAVANQNLHGTSEADLIIITHSDFKSEAERLAAFRRENDLLSVKVVTIEQVYNEFSGGSQDPMAIRDYMKMIYDKTNRQYPKYLLLVGRPCYDYRGRVDGTRIFVPNYQYAARSNVISEFDFYANDDNFGMLDDNEGADMFGLYDLSIGRFPCSTVAQAKTAVDKSINYTAHRNLVGESSSVISNFGDWRNMVAFVADDEDYNDFVSNADNFATIMEDSNANINFDKIYLDAYQQISNAGGQRYPEVNAAISNRMNRGSLFFTYIGHSGKDGWATERILENSDINNWTNRYNQPIMMTLSCSFGYYDRPAVSPAELVFFNSRGGASGLITTAREAWSTPNNNYGHNLFSYFFNTNDYGRYPTLGEMQIRTKNQCGGSVSTLAMFILLGDPSMPLAIPRYQVVTDSINHISVHESLDTIKALSKVTIHGRIVDDNQQTLTNFNGSVFPSVYDKAVTVTTIVNDPTSLPFDFKIQKSILFKGNNSVTNGHFTFSFYVPKDIDYDYGNGKISYYARSDRQDAAGAFTNFIIGGTDTNGINDTEGPVIELFLNDENFVNGGIVNPNPVLIAKIRDNYGINTTGNGIGHDLTAILDGATESQIVLNDYYETVKDSSNIGTVRYSLNKLTTGKHTILVRAWDINNNHAEAELTFTVASDEKLALDHVLNYPNPFTTHTDFYFEHNRPGETFNIRIQIYTLSGKLIRTLNTVQYMEGNRCKGIPWDGRDDYGDKIGKGVYLYRLSVQNGNNEKAEKTEKLVIL